MSQKKQLRRIGILAILIFVIGYIGSGADNVKVSAILCVVEILLVIPEVRFCLRYERDFGNN